MKAFADAVYFIALVSTRDRWHTHAIAINRQPPGLLVTTEWVLTEVGDGDQSVTTAGSAYGTRTRSRLEAT
jgi:hypothetical protein